jgi:putative copper resistance protein D
MEGDTALSWAAWLAHYVEVSAAMLIFGAALFPFYTKIDRRPAQWPAIEACLLAAALSFAAAAAVALKIAEVTGNAANLLHTGELNEFFFATSFGAVWLSRLALSNLLFAVTLIFVIKPLRPEFLTRLRDGSLLLLSGLVLLCFAGSGHASATVEPNSVLAMAWEGGHLLAAGAWIGGLLPLLQALAHNTDDHAGRTLSVRLLRSFSWMGQITVALLLLGGFATLLTLLGLWNITMEAFLASHYGSILIAKHSLIAAILVVAAINRFVLLPRLGAGTARLSQMRQAILLECILAALVIAAGTVLSQSQPPEANLFSRRMQAHGRFSTT